MKAKAAAEHPAPSRKVIVMLDGRRAPLGAIEMAKRIGNALGLPVHGLLAHATPIPASDVPRILRLVPEALEGIVLEVVVGGNERSIAATLSESAAFVVVGAPRTGPDILRVGELVEGMLAARTGIVIVREGAASRLERILLPLDGRPATASAIGPAAELALRAHATLDIVMVGEAGAGAHAEARTEPGAMPPPRYVDQPQHEWAAFSDEFLHRFLLAIGHCPAGVSTRFFLGTGDPAREILRFARELETDLVVLVWHGSLDEPHGTVFRDVVREASCPVLVLRAPPSEPEPSPPR